MPLNRVLLASIAFEPEPDLTIESALARGSSRKTGSENTGSVRGPQKSASDDETQNEATKLFISCLKTALARSTRSISLPQKQRALNPHKDFTIASSIRFRAPRRSSACCGGTSAVKTHNPEAAQMEIANHDGRAHHRGDSTYTDADEGLAGRRSRLVRSRQRSRAASANSQASYSDDDDMDGVGAPAVDFEFIDYSPMCYRHIREFLQVEAVEYSEVLSGSRWHSIPTPGKSAAQLFFCGKNWVIKTMTNEESEFLRRILHRYYFHVRDNPYTFITHFVGHHRLVIGRETHNIVIMQNVFATKNTIHEKFDLKGSTIGRFASDAEKRRSTCTQKDLDINSPVHVGPERRELIIEQIKKDCDFLKGSMIMDYSFLVGIHVLPSRRSESAAPNSQPLQSLHGTVNMLVSSNSPSAGGLDSTWVPNRSFFLSHTTAHDPLTGDTEVAPGTASQRHLDGRCFRAHDAGMLSNDVPGLRREIYYLGIIDILQEYNARKTLETFTLGFVHDRERISCVNPSDYAARFVSFMSSIIV